MELGVQTTGCLVHHWIVRAILEPKSGSVMYLSVPFDQVPPLTWKFLEIFFFVMEENLISLDIIVFVLFSLSILLSLYLIISILLSLSFPLRGSNLVYLWVSVLHCQKRKKSDGVIFGKTWIVIYKVENDKVKLVFGLGKSDKWDHTATVELGVQTTGCLVHHWIVRAF